MDSARFGEFLKDVLEEANAERIHPKKRRDKRAKKWFYQFPDLDICRKAFDRYSNTSWAWPESEEPFEAAM